MSSATSRTSDQSRRTRRRLRVLQVVTDEVGTEVVTHRRHRLDGGRTAPSATHAFQPIVARAVESRTHFPQHVNQSSIRSSEWYSAVHEAGGGGFPDCEVLARSCGEQRDVRNVRSSSLAAAHPTAVGSSPIDASRAKAALNGLQPELQSLAEKRCQLLPRLDDIGGDRVDRPVVLLQRPIAELRGENARCLAPFAASTPWSGRGTPRATPDRWAPSVVLLHLPAVPSDPRAHARRRRAADGSEPFQSATSVVKAKSDDFAPVNRRRRKPRHRRERTPQRGAGPDSSGSTTMTHDGSRDPSRRIRVTHRERLAAGPNTRRSAFFLMAS